MSTVFERMSDLRRPYAESAFPRTRAKPLHESTLARFLPSPVSLALADLTASGGLVQRSAQKFGQTRPGEKTNHLVQNAIAVVDDLPRAIPVSPEELGAIETFLSKQLDALLGLEANTTVVCPNAPDRHNDL